MVQRTNCQIQLSHINSQHVHEFRRHSQRPPSLRTATGMRDHSTPGDLDTGHKDCFKAGPKPWTILKKASGREDECLRALRQESNLRKFVPEIYGTIEQDGERYLEIQNLLTCFKDASVMDVKMGFRTYREDELHKAIKDTKLRNDMYDKMTEVDENEPTEEERRLHAITKPRYMIWRETVSSTASLGFRIEGMRLSDGTVDKNFKTMRSEEDITNALKRYTRNYTIRSYYLQRLLDLREALTRSEFFRAHELIGSSLLFVHDEQKAGIWLIDFAKTYPLPQDINVDHKSKWELGNHEDGYLAGIDNLIRILESITNLRISKKI